MTCYEVSPDPITVQCSGPILVREWLSPQPWTSMREAITTILNVIGMTRRAIEPALKVDDLPLFLFEWMSDLIPIVYKEL